jgi:polar amino acid transport system substrate-binding protein
LATALFVFELSLSPAVGTAYALDVKKATAKPNSPTSNEVMGGQPTRVTWEGYVGANEQVSSLRLVLPAGCSLAEGNNVTATVLDGSSRIETEYSFELDAEKVEVEFKKPVAAKLLIRVEIHDICLPEASGDYSLVGSYSDDKGGEHDIAPSPDIHVVGVSTANSFISWLGQQPWVESWNSSVFRRIFLNPEAAAAAVPNLFLGWLRSLALVLAGFPLAIPIGLGISFLRMSKFVVVRFISSIYVNVIRGTPLFLQIYIAFFGLPLMGVRLPDYLLGALVLAMNSSAYLAEIFRAGIQSIHKGQFEASASLGMNVRQTMFSVIIPQTVRRVIPTMTSEFILLYKDTSLLAAVGVMEQMNFAKTMVATSGSMTPYVVAALYYLIVTLPLIRVISVFEKKLAATEGREEPPSDKDSPKTRRVGLFKTTAPISAVDAEPGIGITPEEQSSR